MMRAGSAPRPGSPRGAIEAQAQRISVFGSGEIVLVSNTPQDVSWNNENYKFEIAHSNVTDPEDITVEVAGRYLITAAASFAFDSASSGAVGVTQLRVDGVTVAQNTGSYPDTATDLTVALPLVAILDLAVGEVVNLRVNAIFAAGSATVSSGSTLLRLEMHRLS